jgi:hypothetical protein
METEMKKLHWLSTPEGKEKMSKIQKRAWRKRRAAEKKANGSSKAERLIARAKKSEDTKENRLHMYERAAQIAIHRNELGDLTTLIGKQLFLHMVQGGAR